MKMIKFSEKSNYTTCPIQPDVLEEIYRFECLNRAPKHNIHCRNTFT